jgi:hypothetical protein
LNGGDQPRVVACVYLEQIRAADDLIQARLALQCADLLEHALIVARTLHAGNDKLLAANRQAIHLHGGVHDGKQQGSGHDRKADQHQSAQ